jgi:large subunit ribosomal protein L22
MEIKAELNNLRISPRKVRNVADMLKGLDAMRAKSQLDYLARRSAKPISKLLDSAMANAQNNFHLVKENLFIKNVIVGEGTKMKRGRPKGFGSISPIEKKTSHIRIILDERVPGMKHEHKHDEKQTETKSEVQETNKKVEKKTFTKSKDNKDNKEVKKEQTTGVKGLGRRFFRRKAI